MTGVGAWVAQARSPQLRMCNRLTVEFGQSNSPSLPVSTIFFRAMRGMSRR